MFHIRHEKKFFKEKSTEMIIGRGLIALGSASIITIWSLYLKYLGLSDSQIGFFGAFLIIISLLASYFSPPYLQKVGEYKLLVFSLTLVSLAYFSVYFLDNFLFFAGIAIIITGGRALYLESFSILFKNSLSKKKYGALEGILFSIMDVAWIIGPYIAGIIATTKDLQTVFLLGGVISLFSLFYFVFLKQEFTSTKRFHPTKKFSLSKNFKKFLSKKNLRLSYLLALGVNFWFAFLYIYMPLIISEQILGNYSIIGIYIAVINFLLMLVSFKLGSIIKKYPNRSLFIWGYSTLSIVALSLFFVHNIYLLMILTAIGSLWLGVLEPLAEMNFFNQVKRHEEEEYFPIYVTNIEFGGFLGKSIIAAFLLFFSTQLMFILISCFMVIMVILAHFLPKATQN